MLAVPTSIQMVPIMRRGLWLILLLISAGALLWISAPGWLGFSLSNIPVALETGAAMSAKLVCSSEHVSRLGIERGKADLTSYSPAIRWTEIESSGNTVTASLLGYRYSATFRPGLGCTLDIGDSAALDQLSIPDIPQDNAVPIAPVPDVQALVERLLADDVAAGLDTRALLVIRDNSVIAEAYGEGISAGTPLLGWSMGKSITSILIGRLETLGRPLPERGPLFTEWTGDERQQIDLEDLLTMTSGLDWDETYTPGSDSTRMLFLEPVAASRPLTSAVAQAPGSHFYYSSGTTNLLMAMLHRQLGSTQALFDALNQQLRAPLGLSNLTFEPDASGVPVGSSYPWATARDWGRLGLLMLNRGVWNGQTLISDAWIAKALAPNKSANDPRYGYQFWLNYGGKEPRWQGLPDDAYAMMGNRGQTVMMIPSAGLVIVRLGWNAGPYPLERQFAAIIAAS